MADPARKRIFLSYGRGDDDPDYDDSAKSFMRRLYNDLKTDYDVWWDRENLPARGLSFLPEIRQAVENCERLILVVGPHAINSQYVRDEWQHALKWCIPVMPLLFKGEYDIIPPEVGLMNAPDFRDRTKYDARLVDLKRLLAQDDAPLGVLYGVPPLPIAYVERKEALRDLDAKVRAGNDRPVVVTSQQQTVTLHGIGGIGKSTLTAALAQDCDIRRYFTDGLFWIEMGQNAQVVDRMGDVGMAFGDSRDHYQDVRSATVRLSAILHGKHALIVLDDVWDQAHAKPFTEVMSGCRLVITTRQGAIVTKLGATGQPLAKLTGDEAVALFFARLEQTDPTAEPTLHEIANFLDGHTLAISLAAAWMSEEGRGGLNAAGKLLTRLQQGRLFEDLQLDDDDKNQNLELCLRLSYDDLGGDDAAKKADLQRRFRATGIFTLDGSFDRAAAAAVWGDADPEDAETPLTVLTRAGLLERVGEDRYQRHGLLRTYARALLERANEMEAVFARYAEWVIDEAEAFDELPLEEWAKLDPLLPHVHEVGDALAQQFADARENASEELAARVGRFAYNITKYVFNRPQAIETAAGRVLRGLNWLEAGLGAFRRQGDQARQALMLNEIGLAWSALEEKRKALDYYEQALPLMRTVGDKGGEATTLNNIGFVRSALGEKRKALDYCEQALPLMRAVGDRRGEARTLNNIGRVWDALGEKRMALDYYQQALPLRRAVGDRRGEATTLNHMGAVWDALGEKRMALDYHQQALPLQRAVGDRRGEARTLNNIGRVWDALGEKRMALDYHQQALPLMRAVGNRGGEAITCFNIGMIYDSLGDLDRAIEYVERCVDLKTQVADPTVERNRETLARLKRKRDGG